LLVGLQPWLLLWCLGTLCRPEEAAALQACVLLNVLLFLVTQLPAVNFH
jgi:hypothetical protein